MAVADIVLYRGDGGGHERDRRHHVELSLTGIVRYPRRSHRPASRPAWRRRSAVGAENHDIVRFDGQSDDRARSIGRLWAKQFGTIGPHTDLRGRCLLEVEGARGPGWLSISLAAERGDVAQL